MYLFNYLLFLIIYKNVYEFDLVNGDMFRKFVRTFSINALGNVQKSPRHFSAIVQGDTSRRRLLNALQGHVRLAEVLLHKCTTTTFCFSCLISTGADIPSRV